MLDDQTPQPVTDLFLDAEYLMDEMGIGKKLQITYVARFLFYLIRHHGKLIGPMIFGRILGALNNCHERAWKCKG